MHTPSPPIEVRPRDGYMEINYGFMDVPRRVPLDNGLAAKDAPYIVPEGNRMRVVVTHTDLVYFREPMTVTFTYQRHPGGQLLE